MKKKYEIDRNYFELIFKERFLEFIDDYPDSKYLIKTYGRHTPNLIKANNKIDAFITNVKRNEKIKIEEIKENLEFIKEYFSLKKYELEFYGLNSYYSTIYYGNTRDRVFFYGGDYLLCRFIR